MEEVQRKGAVHTWLDWFRPQQGASEAIHPAGVQNADNTDETAREDGAFVLRKFVGKQVGATKPLLAVFSLLLLSGVLRLSSKSESPKLSSHRLSSQNEWIPPSLDEDSIQSYLDDLYEAQLEMNAAWEESEPPLQQAFHKYFTPSVEDGQTLTHDPLEIINNHVDKMQECELPPESPVNVQSDFLQHLHLLVSICRMVTLRLKELEHSVSLENGLQEPDSSLDVEDTLSTSSSIPADSFLDAVGMLGSEWTESLDEEPADELVNVFLEESKHKVANLEARYYFERFLQPYGSEDAVKATPSTAKHQIPYSGQQFRTGALAQAAARIFRENEVNSDYARVRKVHRISESWTDEGLKEAITKQKQENAYKFRQRLRMRREQMHVLRKEGIQNGDLEMNVLFLL